MPDRTIVQNNIALLCNPNIKSPNDHSSNITYHLLKSEDKPELKNVVLTKGYKV